MNDLPDLPEHPLPDEARQRIRGRIRAAAEGSPTRRTGWPAAAVAAAVLVGGAVTGVALVTGGDEGSGAGPAGQSSSPTASETTAQPTLPDVAPRVCDRQVRPYLRGAEVIGRVIFDEGLTSIYGNGTRSIVCDHWDQGRKPDIVTVLQKNAQAPELARGLFRISMNFNGREGEYVAGGVLPAGVTGISYAFPGAATVEADHNDTVWAMHFLSTDKPWDGSARLPKQPTVVTVTVDDGSTVAYSLDPAAVGDFCAQLNHGC